MVETGRRDERLRPLEVPEPLRRHRGAVDASPSETGMPAGTPGRELARFAATLAPEDAAEIRAAIEAACERIEPDPG